jgi:hypothetical protein
MLLCSVLVVVWLCDDVLLFCVGLSYVMLLDDRLSFRLLSLSLLESRRLLSRSLLVCLSRLSWLELLYLLELLDWLLRLL